MTHGRKYGDKDSYPLPIWNGILEHRRRIGVALWEFVWLLDKITVERDGVGWCLGGAPIKIKRIALDLGVDYRSTQRNLDRLETHGYVIRVRTSFGFRFGVRNSRKFGIWKTGGDRTKVSSHSGRRPDRNVRSDRTKMSETKKTLQETQQCAPVLVCACVSQSSPQIISDSANRSRAENCKGEEMLFS